MLEILIIMLMLYGLGLCGIGALAVITAIEYMIKKHKKRASEATEAKNYRKSYMRHIYNN